MIELFSVCTAVKQYSGCKDVTFIWFRNDPARGTALPRLDPRL
jgi:hypothetical protein